MKSLAFLFVVSAFKSLSAYPEYYIIPARSPHIYIKIGSVFEFDRSSFDRIEMGLKRGIEEANKDVRKGYSFKLITGTIRYKMLFQAPELACQLYNDAFVGLIGKDLKGLGDQATSLCRELGIPYFNTQLNWEYGNRSFAVYLHPSGTTLSKAYKQVIEALEWKSFVVIYEHNEGLMKISEMLESNKFHKHRMMIRRLPKGDDYRPLLESIKNDGDLKIFLDCSTEKIYSILKQAQQLGMMNQYYSYFTTSLDFHIVNYEEFKYSGSRIFSFKLLDLESSKMKTAIENLGYNDGKPYLPSVEFGLAYDGVIALTKVFKVEINNGNFPFNNTYTYDHLKCQGVVISDQEKRIYQEIRSVDFVGLTGRVKFDEDYRRSDFDLEITELTSEGLKKIGSWTPTHGVRMNKSHHTKHHKKVMRIITRMGAPFYSLKGHNEHGEPEYDGYSVDLIEEISKLANFSYLIFVVADGKYGSFNKETQEWDGIVKEIVQKNADLAISDLTITHQRAKAVEFTPPFMTSGIGLLYTKQTVERNNSFLFILSPFSASVWVATVFVYILFSIGFFILPRISSSAYNENNTYSNKLQSTKHGSSIRLVATPSPFNNCPKFLASKLLSVFYWCFTLVILSCYVASMSAAILSRRQDSEIKDLNDLVKLSDIKYGTVEGGSTYYFFKESDSMVYKKMWSQMTSEPSVFVNGNLDGVEKVKKGKGEYAFFMETSTLEYYLNKDCDLIQVGNKIDDRSYAIAMPMNSSFRTDINNAVIHLKENGKLQSLKAKWWGVKSEGHCSDTLKEDSVIPLGFRELGVIYLFLILGFTLSLAVSCIAKHHFVNKSILEVQGRNTFVSVEE